MHGPETSAGRWRRPQASGPASSSVSSAARALKAQPSPLDFLRPEQHPGSVLQPEGPGARPRLRLSSTSPGAWAPALTPPWGPVTPLQFSPTEQRAS